MKQYIVPALISLVAMASCVDPVTGPGDEVMGFFEFNAELLPPAVDDAGQPEFKACDFSEFSDTFSFSARFARFSDAGEAIITIGGYHRDAGFDGQVLSGSNSADRPRARVFKPRSADCLCQAQVTETLTVALLSSSQNNALGDACPDRPLDGGVPSPTADGGIRLPDTTPSGFDAVRACGELTDFVEVPSPPEGCPCGAPCSVRYSVKGARR